MLKIKTLTTFSSVCQQKQINSVKKKKKRLLSSDLMDKQVEQNITTTTTLHCYSLYPLQIESVDSVIKKKFTVSSKLQFNVLVFYGGKKSPSAAGGVEWWSETGMTKSTSGSATLSQCTMDLSQTLKDCFSRRSPQAWTLED